MSEEVEEVVLASSAASKEVGTPPRASKRQHLTLPKLGLPGCAERLSVVQLIISRPTAGSWAYHHRGFLGKETYLSTRFVGDFVVLLLFCFFVVYPGKPLLLKTPRWGFLESKLGNCLRDHN